MNKYSFLIIAVLSGITISLLRSRQRFIEEKDSYKSNTEALMSEVRRIQADSSTMALDIKTLTMSLDEYKRFRAEDEEKIILDAIDKVGYNKTKEIKESTVLSLAGSPAGKVNLYIGETALKLTLEKEDADAKEQALPFVCQIQTDQPVEEITAYVDKAIIELFINDGEQACTRRFYLPKAVLRPVEEKTGAWSIDIKGMRSIW